MDLRYSDRTSLARWLAEGATVSLAYVSACGVLGLLIDLPLRGMFANARLAGLILLTKPNYSTRNQRLKSREREFYPH